MHGKRFGSNQSSLVSKIKKERPDLIVVTGDSIDSRRYDETSSIELFSQIRELAPVYFVAGNHEARSGKFDGFEARLRETGIKLLRNESFYLEKGPSKLLVIGIDDPGFKNLSLETISDMITMDEDSSFKILLSHRPELLDLYSKENIDLVFSGHAHGGQIRLPLIGGLLSPHQGIFPEYTSGLYRKENTNMVVSRGLGNSLFPQRIFNRPEIITVILKNEK